MIRHAATAAILTALPVAAAAHPHIFIDTGLRLIVDGENRLTAIEVSWTYDALYSLLILEERGLDPDYDGVLEAAELDALRGFDLNWIEGYEGDTYVASGEGQAALGAPEAVAIAVADGQITSTHIRALAAPLPVGEGIAIKPYDPTYYTAYEITRGIAIAGGTGCEAALKKADLDAAYTLLEEFLYGPRSAEYSEDNFPEVGEAFADEARLTCAPPS